ncbi:peptidase M48 [candidate division LCP-89 bacterium B3_LCP]|uniref:Peptidase M48 n=1 Tax=candidate division LCP-89 bacterium B3_LCP TaxID=2012998 RepID=A0A532V1S6_UNCL8|nr:MAG: peptidase M48 [candidate division LCP-89 bacterium B3_LCP]
MKTVRIIPFLLIITFLIGCATVPLTGRQQLTIIPQYELLALSLDSYQQVMAESNLSQDREDVRMIRQVGRGIAQAAEDFLRENGLSSKIRNYQWEFNLIDNDTLVNAWCMPGGKVAFYSGILPVCQNSTGVAVVMGHEVAHALANHGGERMSQGLITQLGGVALDLALKEKSEETRMIALTAFCVGAQVGVLLPYSRLHESEADHIGLILMAKAGYDPREAVPFWERMNLEGGVRPPEFISTHPAPETRVEKLKEQMPEALQYYNP